MRLYHSEGLDLPTIWRALSLNPGAAGWVWPVAGYPLVRPLTLSCSTRMRPLCAGPLHSGVEIQEHAL